MINIIIIFCILIIYIIHVYLIYFDKSEINTEKFIEKSYKKEIDNDNLIEKSYKKEIDNDNLIEKSYKKETDNDNLIEQSYKKETDDDNKKNLINISKNMQDRNIINERNNPNLIINNQHIENISKSINFDNPAPWNRIIKNTIYENQYQINIDNFDDNKFINWKKLIPLLDYNIDNQMLNITSNNENISLAIINLVLSDFNNEITFKEIIDHDLINISLNKLNNSKVKNKIIKLILKNKKKSLYINKVNTNILNEKPLNFSFNNISGYSGNEYSKI